MRKLILAALLALAAPAAAAPADDFRALLADHWAWFLRENPTYASTLGHSEYDGQMPDLSLEAADRRAAEARVFLDRLNAIPAERISEADRVNQAMLRRNLSEQIEANRFGQRMILFSNRWG